MAFPRFNQITGAVTAEVPGQWQKQWLDRTRLIWQDGTHTLIDGVSTGQKGYNILAAGGGRWAGSFQPRVYGSAGTLIEAEGGDPFMDHDGALVYLRPFNADSREIVKVALDGSKRVVVVAKRFLNSPRICGELITYRAAGGLYAQYRGVMTLVPPIGEDVFWPVPFFVKGQPWVLTTTHTGYVLRPIDSFMGHRFDNNGKTFNPDVWVDSQHTINVVYGLTSGGGTTVRPHPASEPLTDVRRATPIPPEPPEPPVTIIKPKATIASYDNEVTLPETATAVAKVTQGQPDRFRWQYHDGGEWRTSAEQPVSDLDHAYAFPRAGQFPIRLQTIDDGKVVDTSSDTSRVVTVHASATPPEPPDPTIPTSQGFYLRADAGQYACAEEGGGSNVLANRTAPGLWETFVAQDAKDGLIAIRTSTGHYFTVKNDQLWADATSVGATEKFKVTNVAAGVICLQDTRGLYVVAEEGGGGIVSVRAPGGPEPGPWEKWTTNLSTGGGVARPGLTRGSGRHFVDDKGVFLPYGGTLFWAMRGWKYERDRVKQNINWLAGKGQDFIRILAQVGWSGNEISESWPDHVQILGEVIDYAYSVGMRTQVTGIGGGSYNADKVVSNMIAAIKPRASKVIYNEVANEWWSNFEEGETKMKALGRQLKASLPNLIALSAPREEMCTQRSAGWVKDGAANMGTGHLDRNDKASDWKWRHVRKPWEPRNPSFPESHGEPGGPLSSVASFMEPIHLVMSRAVGILCGFDSYVLHNAAGVQGKVDPAHHRPANVWETPGIDRVMQVVRALDQVLPPTASDGTATRTGQSGHPLSSDTFWPNSKANHGVVRDYARRNGGQFWQCLQGIKNYANLKANKSYALTLIDPVTLAQHQMSVAAGHTIKIERGSVDSRGYGAWIIKGHE